MAKRYSGDLTVNLQWKDAQKVNGTYPPHGGYYACTVVFDRRVVSRSSVFAPAVLHVAVDSAVAYDQAARAALSFANDEESEIGEQAAYSRRLGTWHIGRTAAARHGGD